MTDWLCIILLTPPLAPSNSNNDDHYSHYGCILPASMYMESHLEIIPFTLHILAQSNQTKYSAAIVKQQQHDRVGSSSI